jgi:hypothetical protein
MAEKKEKSAKTEEFVVPTRIAHTDKELDE